jgi:endonuclease-3
MNSSNYIESRMKGTYVLIVLVKRNKKIKVGKLGKFLFKKGYYVYVGSAFGKIMNIKNRIKRYKKLVEEKRGNLKWHIDYLLVTKDVEITDVIIFRNRKIECEIAKKLKVKAKIPVKKFGSSDCKCPAHLFYLDNKTKMTKILNSGNKFNI